ncbi:efflux RND transporter periplasmic adaptor subunit [Mesorhizobium sp. VK23B]|uniref:Efflux RND transporter periplasmic adaptor subunit n=1 Tax=Mesorhizobium dulcispinae TaxID=3072316 RepID=A0ABU4XPK8_9HYPH|nr:MULTISPECIES: efflux RND transporter periplasmic adaptor subunit [unclassified Mesorhizobium]MDX8470263.1 efflux RND transporter periplasmic adaptor subunit [Mesorhizobium sp. VK23B]MDX8476682.1 efflux RND transporter periplasmic adaptor subunit [Mesorhizobium sp. VK23A]
MNKMIEVPVAAEEVPSAPRKRSLPWLRTLVLLGAAAGGAWYAFGPGPNGPAGSAAQAAPPPPEVMVSQPLARKVDTQVSFIGQFTAMDGVELRAQVGGTLTEIHFRDGQIVHKGDLLFVIDPRPYEIKLSQAQAQLETAASQLSLAQLQLTRAQTLRKTEAGSQEVVDQRRAEQTAAQAAVDEAQARVHDAELDVDYSRVTAPFTGRIGARQVSVGSLVGGNRGGVSGTTLLATLVSLDPIYLDFDLSEADYLAFSRAKAKLPQAAANDVAVALTDETAFSRHGKLDFIDNSLNRSSGTIRARATLANQDLFLTPGSFARLRLAVTPPAPVLLVPDAAVLLDQSQRIVMTVGADGLVVPKPVVTGDLRGGLRVIRSGLDAADRVIIDGIVRASPGHPVTAQNGSIKFDAASDAQ